MKDHYVKASGSNGPCYIVMDTFNGSDRPVMLFGSVRVQATRGRDSPPDPVSQFPMDRTPFDKGHIMALELGGPDIQENIVPQYHNWQSTGTWRKMETSLSSTLDGTKDRIFVAFLTYGSTDNNFNHQFGRLTKEEIFDWADYRIPTSFDIWVIKDSTKLGGQIDSQLLSSSATNRLMAAGNLKSSVLQVTATHTLDQSTMPPEDKMYWQDQHIYVAVTTEQDLYNDSRTDEWGSQGLSPMRDSTYEFLKKPENFGQVKRHLENKYKWQSSDTSPLDFHRVLKSVVGPPKKKLEKLYEEKLRKREEDRTSQKKTKFE
ncbi:Hypothetical protein A7982_07948 [Minicystis rosea]|nr:Hypothetical protein A7982_07948 [Minicystis rosea]